MSCPSGFLLGKALPLKTGGASFFMRYILILFLCLSGCTNKAQKLLREASSHIAQANASASVIYTNAEEIESSCDRKEYERIPELTANIKKEVVNQKKVFTLANKAIAGGADAAMKDHDKFVKVSDNWIGPGAVWWLKLIAFIAGGVAILVFVFSPANLISIVGMVFSWFKMLLGKVRGRR